MLALLPQRWTKFPRGYTAPALTFFIGRGLIAECKFWKGAKAFSDAIYQLFDNYLTWRETKAVLMIFVKEGNITDIETKIKEAAKTHPYYKRSHLSNATMSYIFHTKSDVNCEVYFDTLVFHFPHKQLKQEKK